MVAAVRRCAAPLPQGLLPGYRALGRCLDRAVLDALADLLELRLQRGRHLAVEVVERSQRNAAVGERADVVAALERAAGRGQHRGLHRQRLALQHAGDEVLAVRRRADAAVEVHPLHVHLLAAGRGIRLLDRLGRAEPHVARDREDDVRALADERLGERLALGLVGEVSGERALLGLLVPAEYLHVRAVLLVVVLHTVPVAVHVDGDGRELLPAERRDLAGLAHARGQVAAEEGVLHRVEHQRVHVRQRRLVAEVHDRELLARVRRGRRLRGVAHREAKADDDVALLAQERVDDGRVVARRRRRREFDAYAAIGRLGRLHAGPRRGVERPVVDPAGVADHAADELAGGRGRAARAGRRARRGGAGGRGRALAAAARGDKHRRGHGQRRGGPCAVFHAYLHWASTPQRLASHSS